MLNRDKALKALLRFYRLGKHRGGHHRKPLPSKEQESQEAERVLDEIVRLLKEDSHE